MQKHSTIIDSIDAAIVGGRLMAPFSNKDFEIACPGFGKGTYNAFLWKHRRGNPDHQKVYFEKVGPNLFRRVND